MPAANFLALDVGERRIGVALANAVAKLPAPLTTLDHDDTFMERLSGLIQEHDIGKLVIGLPRGLEGQDTAQTSYVRHFAAKLQQELGIPIILQDEAVTSVQARAELDQKGKTYDKKEIDALAATYILQDFIDTQLKSEAISPRSEA
jgi:putative holliday junction resolvase